MPHACRRSRLPLLPIDRARRGVGFSCKAARRLAKTLVPRTGGATSGHLSSGAMEATLWACRFRGKARSGDVLPAMWIDHFDTVTRDGVQP